MIKKIGIWIFVLTFFAIFFAYRLNKVPKGLTVDEAAFGYNAVLLSETYHDENGRFLPFFVLSIEGKDWRQPVTQYFMAFFFKIFGASKFKARFTSVIVVLSSLVLTFYLTKILMDKTAAYLASFIYLTIPIVMIHAHMALDNIMPVPFVLGWLLFLVLADKTDEIKYLLFAGISLGIGFYTYKGMRAIVPVWCILTGFYFFTHNFAEIKKLKFQNFFKQGLYFTLGIAPFLMVIPILQKKYAGAVFDRQSPQLTNIYNFIYPYLSSFDLSFLFVKGDRTIYHSTGRHGMFLLVSLPLFLTGIYYIIKKKKGFLFFVLASFFSGPLLYGLVNSVHRASRLLALIPLFVLISTLGAREILRRKKYILVGIILLMLINYINFVNYYWWTYPKMSQQKFSQSINIPFKKLSQEAEKRGLKPVIDTYVFKSNGESAKFYNVAYFDQLEKLQDGQDLAPGSILLTNREDVDGLTRLKVKVPNHYLHVLKE